MISDTDTCYATAFKYKYPVFPGSRSGEKRRSMVKTAGFQSVSPNCVYPTPGHQLDYKQYTVLAPAQYIAQLRLQQAKALLSTSKKSIKEIAVEMNYESVDYFSTQFRRQTKMTPTQYRNGCFGRSTSEI